MQRGGAVLILRGPTVTLTRRRFDAGYVAAGAVMDGEAFCSIDVEVPNGWVAAVERHLLDDHLQTDQTAALCGVETCAQAAAWAASWPLVLAALDHQPAV